MRKPLIHTFSRELAQLHALPVCSMGNKMNREDCVQLQDCNLIGVTEMWWDNSCNWNVAVVGYKLSRKARLGEQQALYVRQQWEHIELYLGMGQLRGCG